MTIRIICIAIISLCLFLGYVSGTPDASGQEVMTERKIRFLPAGPGEKPFDVTRHIIPLEEIQGGGPPRDGIPTLLNPNFLKAYEMGGLLRDSDTVLGVFLDGEAKAYPIRILNWHELVNDSVGSRPILVSW